MHDLTIVRIQRALRDGDTSCRELVDTLQARIDALNPRLNAYIYQDTEANRRLADLRDQMSPDTWGPLHGIPISIKECFLWEQTPTTLNFPLFKNYTAKETSRLVKRLLDAGAIPLGKTNVPILLADSQTFGPLYPTANNPYDLDRTPGGSTGGGAAAVAAGLSIFE